MYTSRERVEKALNHQEADRIPLDLGGSDLTGMHVSIVYHFRQALGLDSPGTPVKVVEPYQMLGEIGSDLVEKLGVDVVTLRGSKNIYGFENKEWKEWQTFDGTPVLVPSAFNTQPAPNGDILMYPEGDHSAPPSGRMPKGGWYFDDIVRTPSSEGLDLNVKDNLEEFKSISNEELDHFKREAERLFYKTDKAILADFGGMSFGDIGLISAPWLKHPRGIRGPEEWYVSLINRQDYIVELFDQQCEIAQGNIEKIHRELGDKITVVYVSGADFGMQTGPLISPSLYRKLFQPFHARINDCIHENTSWKTFMHSDGSIIEMIEDFIDAGFDILNPVQCSASNMDPQELKLRFGDRITFWGGGIETQNTLPFGTPDEVREEVRDRIQTFGQGGGFVFSAVHNIQPQTPVENLLAVYRAIHEFGGYSS